MFISELFEPGKDYEWQFRGSEEAMADFKVGNIPYRFYAFTDSSTPGSWEVEFKNKTRDKPMGRTAKFGLTGTGNAAEVMATVSDIMREFLQQYKGSVNAITFTADEESRKSLYMRMVKRLLPDWDLTVHDGNLFVVTAPEELAEYKEYPLEQFHGVTMKLKVDAHEVIVQALDDWDNVMGYARLNVGDLDELDPQDLSVDPRYQGQGIAKVMYDYLKSHGYEIHRSYDQTDAGAGFWNKHRGEERVWEDLSRRGFLGALGAGAMAASGVAQAKTNPTPKPVANNPKVELLMNWAKKFIKDPRELAAFMAQCAHESDNFKAMEEYGSPERFAKKYDIQYNPEKARQLGNDKPGDGIKYKGRGYIQLTGKYNYQKASEWISKYLSHPIDFVKQPDLVATPTAAALSSIWYWMTFVHPKAKNFSNTKQVTKHINPGMRGQANREQKARDWQTALNVKPIKPGKPIKVASR